MAHETPSSNLPEGWTCHELNGRPFWYHAASNTIQQEPPLRPLPVPRNDMAMYPCPPEPASEPVPLAARPPLPPAVQIQPGAYMSPHMPQVPAGTMPTAQVVQVTPSQSMPYPGSPMPLAAQAMAQAMAQPNAQAIAQANIHPEMPIYAQRPEQHMVNLPVLVPDPGLRPGQQLAFTAPPQRSGQPSQPMLVTVNQEVLPGSIITVQYPGSVSAAPSVSAVARIPQPSVYVTEATDSEYMKYAWLLYASGCCCMFCFAPLGILLWVVASSLYFCKPAPERAQMPRTRSPAFAAAITALCCLFCGGLLFAGSIAVFEEHGGNFEFGPNDNSFHHGQHGSPGDFLRGSHGHPPQFFQRFFQAMMHHQSQDHHHASFTGQVPEPMADGPVAMHPWPMPPPIYAEAMRAKQVAELHDSIWQSSPPMVQGSPPTVIRIPDRDKNDLHNRSSQWHKDVSSKPDVWNKPDWVKEDVAPEWVKEEAVKPEMEPELADKLLEPVHVALINLE